MTGKIIPTAYLDLCCHNLGLILFVSFTMGRFLVAGIICIPADCCCSPLHSQLSIKQSHICCVFFSHVFHISDILIWILSNQPKGQCPHIAPFSSHCSQLLWRRAELSPAAPQPSHSYTSRDCACPFFLLLDPCSAVIN